MSTSDQREDSLRLLALLHRQHRNQRKIYVALAIAVACLTAVILHAIWYPAATGSRIVLAFGAVCLTSIASMWFVHRLSRENDALGREAAKLAAKLKLI